MLRPRRLAARRWGGNKGSCGGIARRRCGGRRIGGEDVVQRRIYAVHRSQAGIKDVRILVLIDHCSDQATENENHPQQQLLPLIIATASWSLLGRRSCLGGGAAIGGRPC
jgi:hypothetical protein